MFETIAVFLLLVSSFFILPIRLVLGTKLSWPIKVPIQGTLTSWFITATIGLIVVVVHVTTGWGPKNDLVKELVSAWNSWMFLVPVSLAIGNILTTIVYFLRGQRQDEPDFVLMSFIYPAIGWAGYGGLSWVWDLAKTITSMIG